MSFFCRVNGPFIEMYELFFELNKGRHVDATSSYYHTCLFCSFFIDLKLIFLLLHTSTVLMMWLEQCIPCSTLKFQRCALHHILGDNIDRKAKGIMNVTTSTTTIVSKVIAIISSFIFATMTMSLFQKYASRSL